MNNVFVYIEMEGGRIADVSLELLTKGRELAAALGVKTEAVALGESLDGIEKELARYGADTVWVADDKIFNPFRTLPHTAVMCGLIEQEKPQIALFGAGSTRTCCTRSVRRSAATSSPRSSIPTTGRRWPPSARA